MTFVFDTEGLKEIQCEWQHDAYTSADILSSYDADGDKKLSDEEAKSLARGLVQDLREYGYFSVIKVDGAPFEISGIAEAEAAMSVRKLWFSFTIPCRVELRVEPREVRIAQYDPEYFIAFEYGLFGYHVTAPAGIEHSVKMVKDTKMDADAMVEPEALALRFRRKPPVLEGADPSSDSLNVQTAPSDLESEQESEAESAPAQDATDRRGALEWLALQQKNIQAKMEEILSDENTGQKRAAGILLLCLMAFCYGVLHAAGPGHGKVVTASWLAGERRRLLSGVALGSLLALFHGLSGIAVVLAGRFLMEKTAMVAMGDADKPLKVLSFAMIAAVGAYMLVKELRMLMRRSSVNELSENRADCPSSDELVASAALSASRASVRKDGSLVMVALAAGLVPCPGVVLVMLFASAMGQTLTGLLLAACVTLGMALTISAVGVVTVVLRGVITASPRIANQGKQTLETGLRLLGGAMVLLLGVVFLFSTIAG